MYIVETKTLRVFLEPNEKLEDIIKKLENTGYIVLGFRKAETKTFCDVFDIIVKVETKQI